MNQLYDKQTEKRYISLSNVIAIASCISVLYLFQNKAVSLIGGCALIVIILMSICMRVAEIRRGRANVREILWALIVVYSAALVAKNPSSGAIYQWAQMSLLLMIHTILNRIPMKLKSYGKMKQMYKALFWIILIVYLLIQATGNMNASKKFMSPTIMKCLIPLSFFAFEFKSYGLMKVFLLSAACFVLGERASVVAILAVYVFYLILKRWNNNRLWNVIFAVVLLLAIAMPFVYVWMSEQPWRPALDAFMFEYTGQRFFSGRNILWGIIIDGVQNHQMTGVGFGNSLLLSHDITLSAHNVYMYLYMSGGMLLVALFVLYLYLIWRRYCRLRGTEVIAKTAAYFLGLIIFMDFELFMIVNNIVVSLFWWITLTVPYNTDTERSWKRERKK